MHPEFENFDQRGRRLRYICRGEGTPAVVIDQGSGISVEQSFLSPYPLGWQKVFTEIAKSTRVLMHDRAGLGWSYEPPTPRSCTQLVKDLRAVLRNAEVGPPYVLVGHSIGGFNVRLFANQYPDEVAGVVLVDSSHPDQWSRFARTLPRQALGEPAELRRFRQKPDPLSTPERIDFTASADEMRTVGTLGDKPLIVLSRSPQALRVPGLPADLAERMEQVWAELQRDLLHLSTRSTQVIATCAGHNIQLDEPQLVSETVLKLVRDIRMPRPALH